MKNPIIATLLNLIPGLGYIYVGGKRKVFGIALLAGAIAGLVAISFDPMYADMAARTDLRTVDLVYLASSLLVMGAFMYDGFVAANLHNASISKKKK